jgi:prolyl-tRNA editing enzyme YbaK/EbsC (Cys-tRNA(Pro) deacylase)
VQKPIRTCPKANKTKEALMSIEKVKEYFNKFNMEDKILEFETSSATVELAARALGCEEKRIAKTLSLKTITVLFL